MFTLLPEKNMTAVIGEYHLRLTVVGLSLFVVAAILAVVLLSPSFVLISSREKIVTEKLATVLASQQKLLAGNPDEIAKNTKELFRLLTTRSAYPKASAILDRVTAHQIDGVRITAFNTTVNDTVTDIVVSGVASTRQTLSTFVKKLEADSAFNSVSIPVSNFTKSTNLEFALSISVKPNAL